MQSIQPQTREKSRPDRVAAVLIALWIAMSVVAIAYASGLPL